MALAGAGWAIWWRIEGKVDKARSDAMLRAEAAAALASAARAELAEHKLHVSETYVTKAGMSEQTGQIMKAIEGVGMRIDGLGTRLDRLYEPNSRRTKSS